MLKNALPKIITDQVPGRITAERHNCPKEMMESVKGGTIGEPIAAIRSPAPRL